MDTEIKNFIKQNSKKKSKKRTTTKRNTKGKLTGGNSDKSGIGNIVFDDRFEPL